MAGFRMDAEVVGGYAKTVDAAAEELGGAVGGLRDGALTEETFGTLGKELGLVESYARAAAALRGQLEHGAVALRSASEALHKVTTNQSGGDGDAAVQIKKAGEL
ncbi:hypothetical protein [Amycolatopsis anabasis]|uniref:hypothetical protein n=1 Tax=Amycolatopsis anabasis TaxID=1840409 RepID=UPI0015D44F6D|nr:hypothetical protein [Amycolatopsis anabasis]